MRELESKPVSYGENAVSEKRYAGKHAETKPKAGVATGSLFLETDTGDVYAYNEDDEAWSKICALGGGA